MPERVELALRTSPYIADAIVIMAGQQVGRCLLMLEEEPVRRYAQERDLTFSDYASLASNPDVVALLAEQVDQVNRRLDDSLRVKRFDIIARPLHPDDDELTPSLRLNRRVVQQNYSSLLETRP
jgi:long-chain acyl-CoA synthetase